MRARRAETPARPRQDRGSTARPGATAARRSWPQSYRGLLRAQPGPERSGGTRPNQQFEVRRPRKHAMRTVDEIVMHAGPERCFRFGAEVERWPEWLPHYRWVRFRRKEGFGTGLVEMAAVRRFGP